MVDDRRLDSKLTDLQRDLMSRPLLPGFPIADAFTMRGIDETGKPGMFAAVLLAPTTMPELETLTTLRFVLTQKLKQLDTTIPAWPIVVQGAPEFIDGQPVVPGGREHFELLKRSLEVRRMPTRPSYPEMPIVVDAPATPVVTSVKRSAKKVRAAVRKHSSPPKAGERRRPAARAKSARTARR